MDARTPCGGLNLTVHGRSFKVQFFEAEKWDGKPGAQAGRYRVQRGRSWFSPRGEKYEFLRIEEVLELARRHTADADLQAPKAQDETPSARPDLRPGQRVRWMRQRCPAHERPGIQTAIKTKPFLAANNTWCVFLAGGLAYLGTDDPVPCNELEPI